MKKYILLSVFISALVFFFENASISQEADNFSPRNELSGNCTSIMAGKLATTDGSVITSHTCDGLYRTSLDICPHTKYEKGAIHEVYSHKLMPENLLPEYNLRIEKTGEIPEAEETFAFVNTAYPCLNEKQLAIGETTIVGRTDLRNPEGIFYIEELEKIALQRCTDAREAIKLIGRLAEEYGYGDYGECITIADPDEVWQLEITGSGKGKPSAIWCAARIPDDHVGVSANIPRISTIDFNNPDMFMYSTDLKNVARKLGYWDGKEPMKFYRIIGGDKDKPFSFREFYILSTLAPSLNLSLEAEELPFSVKPEKKLSVFDVMKYFRETYEGTPWDMTKNTMVTLKKWNNSEKKTIEETVKAPNISPWMPWSMRVLLNQLKPGTVDDKYTIAQTMCSYSHVIQCRKWLPDEVGAVAWFSFDNPALSPRIPIFSGVLRLPPSFKICGQGNYRPDAALWSFREANRLSIVNWSKGRKLIEPAVMEFETKAMAEVPQIEKSAVEMISRGNRKEAREYLTGYTNNFAYSAMKKWEEIKGLLWSDFMIWL